MVTLFKGTGDELVVMPSVERMSQLIKQEYSTFRDKVKQLSQAQESISFSIHIWNPNSSSNNEMLVITAFYIDESWNWKDIIVEFQFLNSTLTMTCGKKFNLLEKDKQKES